MLLTESLLLSNLFTVQEGVRCVVKKGGSFGANAVVTIPGTILDLPILTEEDCEDIECGLKCGIDMVAASRVRKADDIESVYDALGKEGQHVKVMAKI